MPLRTGRQVLIGNGSSVALFGVQQVEREHLESWEEEPGHWVYFMAHIECEQVPPSGNTTHVVLNHARAIWVLMCPNSFERPHTSLIYPPDDGSGWMRVMFRRRIEGKLREPGKYLHAIAKVLESIWKLVHYAEYGGASENKELTLRSGQECPIQPYQVHVIKRTPTEKIAFGEHEEDVPLGFGSDVAEKVAASMLDICRARGEWGTFHNYGLLPRQTLVELLREKWQMTSEEYDAGLRYLIENEYLAEGTGAHTHFLREKFVVQCWHASLRP